MKPTWPIEIFVFSSTQMATLAQTLISAPTNPLLVRDILETVLCLVDATITTAEANRLRPRDIDSAARVCRDWRRTALEVKWRRATVTSVLRQLGRFGGVSSKEASTQ
jgi:hypothetical protein